MTRVSTNAPHHSLLTISIISTNNNTDTPSGNTIPVYPVIAGGKVKRYTPIIGYARGDCRLQATEESGHVAALRYNRWSGDAPTSRSRPDL